MSSFEVSRGNVSSNHTNNFFSFCTLITRGQRREVEKKSFQSRAYKAGSRIEWANKAPREKLALDWVHWCVESEKAQFGRSRERVSNSTIEFATFKWFVVNSVCVATDDSRRNISQNSTWRFKARRVAKEYSIWLLLFVAQDRDSFIWKWTRVFRAFCEIERE